MSNPNRVLIWMTLFLTCVLIAATLLHQALLDAFFANHLFNGMILAVLIIGVLVNIRQVVILHPDVTWLDRFPASLRDRTLAPRLLLPMAKMLEKRTRGHRMSAMTMRSVLDGIRMRLDESRDISRYLTGLLVFLGLLGTFWGLLDTIGGVSAVIAELSTSGAENGDVAASFQHLMQSIQTPLGGMGTAFSSSLFGLGGAVVIGFLDLQAGHVQNRFFNELEDRLSDIAHVSGGTLALESDQGLPGLIEALLEQTADSLDRLQLLIARNEEARTAQNSRQLALHERIADLLEQLRSEQRVAQGEQAELAPALRQLTQQLREPSSGGEQMQRHIRNLDVTLGQLLQESTSGRERLIEELRREVRLLAHALSRRPPESE